MEITMTLSIEAANLIKNAMFGVYVENKKYADEGLISNDPLHVAMLEGHNNRRDLAFEIYDQLGICFSSANIREVNV